MAGLGLDMGGRMNGDGYESAPGVLRGKETHATGKTTLQAIGKSEFRGTGTPSELLYPLVDPEVSRMGESIQGDVVIPFRLT